MNKHTDSTPNTSLYYTQTANVLVKDGGYRGVRKWYDHEEEFFIIICNLTPPTSYIVGNAVYNVPSWDDYNYNDGGKKNLTVNNYYW